MNINIASTTTQNETILSSLLEFYKNDLNRDTMLNIITGNSKISLRIIDWFATNYAKKHHTIYSTANKPRFVVYEEYKSKLKAYSKQRFDPFCRRDRICIPYDQDKKIETTLGQLNFFKWAIENNVVKYISDNYSTIENDMLSRNSTSKKKDMKSNTKTRKKREELSISATKSIKKEDIKIVLKFN